MRIERQLQGVLATIFSEQIVARGLEHKLSKYTTQEEGRADISIKTKEGKTLFFLELKDPTAADGRTVFDFKLIQRETKRAEKLGVAYFGICNFFAATFLQKGSLDNSDFTGEVFTKNEYKYLQKDFTTFIEKDAFQQKLRNIADFYLDKAVELLAGKTVTTKSLDAFFIFVIKELLEAYVSDIAFAVQEKYQLDPIFAKKINDYTTRQLWNNPTEYEEFENLTFISLLVLVSKLIFYKTYYDSKAWTRLAPLQVPENIDIQTLKTSIFHFFEDFKSITGNFETLIGDNKDAIFEIPFVAEKSVGIIRQIIDFGALYDFSKIDSDVIGRIFEEFIRPDERHKLGQYFTPPAVIDFMLAFVIKTGDERVLDPSCGSGTFLVKSYERKRQISSQQHAFLLEQVWGNDLSNYPAYLASLNLAIRNTARPSYPRILNKDFFAITQTQKQKYHDHDGKLQNAVLPKFDVIIGNPPYTRQEDIGALQGTQTKDQILKLLLQEQHLEVSKRGSLYAYFFYRAQAFLRPNGYIAFVVSNSWLETDFGADLQAWICKHFEIVAIVDSEVERFFPAAAVNTTIVILKNTPPADTHQARFIYLRRPLETLLAAVSESTDPIVRADALCAQMLAPVTTAIYPDYRLTLVPQSQLHEDHKWSKYLKAPDVYFKILAQAAPLLRPLKEIATVKRGFTTGCNEFFILKDVSADYAGKPDLFVAIRNNVKKYTNIAQVQAQNLVLVKNGFDECWLLEKEFVRAMLTSPKDINKYKFDVSMLKYQLLALSLDKNKLKKYPFAEKYILDGEKRAIHEKPSCASRKIWYNLNVKSAPNLSFNYMINDFGRTFFGEAYTNDNFHNIILEKNTKTIWLLFNSTFSWLWQQLAIRSNFGDGVGKIQTYELNDFPIIDIDLEDLQVDLGETKGYKLELGDASSLAVINPERRQLDEAILKKIGYTDAKIRQSMLLELYQQTYALIQARLDKSKSTESIQKAKSKQKNEWKESAYIEQVRKELENDKAKASKDLKFSSLLMNTIIPRITSNKAQQKKLFAAYWQDQFKEKYDAKQLAKDEQGDLFG